MPAVSKKQRNLLGFAYAYSKGKIDDAPESVKKIAKSFTKKGKKRGLKKLRDFAKTKHVGLPNRVSEGRIFGFNQFINENENIDIDEEDNLEPTGDVFEFLYNLSDDDINTSVNIFMTTDNTDEMKDCVEDILLEVDDKVEDNEFEWIKKELDKELQDRIKIKTTYDKKYQ